MQKPMRILECPREEQKMRDENGDPISSETQNWAWSLNPDNVEEEEKKKKIKKKSKDFLVFY